jgi:hypothetical protein
VGFCQPGTNDVVFRLIIGRCVGTRDGAPFSKGLASLVSFGSKGMRGLRDAQINMT